MIEIFKRTNHKYPLKNILTFLAKRRTRLTLTGLIHKFHDEYPHHRSGSPLCVLADIARFHHDIFDRRDHLLEEGMVIRGKFSFYISNTFGIFSKIDIMIMRMNFLRKL